MSASERERRERRAQLRRTRSKLHHSQLQAEERHNADLRRGEQEWGDLVERRIQEALAAGAFENLSGQGKPVDLTRNPYLDPSLELAYGLLKDNGYAPEWITRDKEIRQQLETARAHLRAAWAQYKANPGDEAFWRAAVARFEEALAQINRKIDDFNLIVPIPSRQRAHLRLSDELSWAIAE